VLLERAGGNPLYAEQFAELYVERGSTDELALPETLQGIIAARLDGLSPEEKALLQDAAVVGKVFWTGALGRDARNASAALHSLERKGFVRRQRRSSVEGENELAFAHALVRDVAYGQIPRAERAEKHRRVARWIESLGRPQDHAEMRAYHWRSALELVRASGADHSDLIESTRFALRDGGDRAFGLNSHAAAAALYTEALELWPHDDPARPDLLFRRARALYEAYDEERREAALEEARDALLAAGDPVRAGEVETFLANVAFDRGRGDRVGAHLERARELVGDSTSESAARVLATSARIRCIHQDSTEALAQAEAALEMAAALCLDELRAHALTTVGMARNDLEAGSGTADMERALELALAVDSPIAPAIVNNLAVQATVQGDLLRSDELYAEALRLAERFGSLSNVRFIRGNRVWMHWMRGRWDDAFEHANRFIAECELRSPHALEPFARSVRAAIRHARGDSDGAFADLDRSVELTLTRAYKGDRIQVLSLLAQFLVSDRRLDEARSLVDELVTLVRSFGAHGALTQFGLVAEELGAVDAIRGALAEGTTQAPVWLGVLELVYAGDFGPAADAMTRIGAVTTEAHLRRKAGEVHLANGRVAEGVDELERALTFFHSVGATRYVAEVESELAEAQSASA
jgi:tetratricopeptide (TPR) repeat protein